MRRIAFAVLASSSFTASGDALSDLKEAARAQTSSRVAQELNLPTAAPVGARVYIIEPKNGAEVSGPVTVVFGLAGMGVAPAGTQNNATGHHHLLIDEPEVNFSLPLPVTDQVKHYGGGQTQDTLTLKPGTHTLQLALGDWKHQTHNPPLLSEKITITVR